jgi:hypothetical protein
MFSYFCSSSKIYDISYSDFEIIEVVNNTIYRLLFYKISNFIELSDMEIHAINLLNNNEKIKIIKLLIDCMKQLIYYDK